MLRAVLNVSRKDHPTNIELYGQLNPLTEVVRERRLRFVGHSFRSNNELVSKLLLWSPTHGLRKPGRPHRNYINQLVADTDLSISALPRMMENREEWKRIVNRI